MTDKNSYWESFKAEGAALGDKLKELLREGNVRRVVVKHGDNTVAEFPLAAGLIGALLAPVVAAILALVAVLKDCSIHLERVAPADKPEQPGKPDSANVP